MKQQFIQKGYKIVAFEQIADIYIVNTCTVTNISDKKSRQILRRTKEENPQSFLIVTGCYAQVAKNELEKIEEIDLILGNNEKNNMVEYVEKYLQHHQTETIITDVMGQKEFLDFGSTKYTDKTRAVIKIQDGCDRFCSYCIIPYARGRVRSRKLENIIKEVEEIAKEGIKEVVITGIHIASYGKDFKEKIGLIELLEAINQVDNIKRIRLGSLEPTIITQEFVDRLSRLEKICDHFHLSLQSGCNETLKRMNRKYTIEEFEECTKRLRKVYPHVALTTDIIVGFPGETKQEFEETYTFLKNIDFYKMHVFKYSPRKGTKAAIMQGQVDGNKKEERSNRLLSLSEENQKRQNEEYITKEVEVLLEEEINGFVKGHTTNYIVVTIEGKKSLENTIQKVLIEENRNGVLYGKIREMSQTCH